MTDRYQLFGADGPDGQASLLALPLEGEPPYTYLWHVLNPSGRRADALLDATDIADPRFTATALDGAYDVFCTITDARGCPFTGKLVLTIGVPVGLDMKVARLGVVAGGGRIRADDNPSDATGWTRTLQDQLVGDRSGRGR